MSGDDINWLRGAVTLVSFVAFVVLVRMTWAAKRKPEHEAAAELPFAEEQGDRRE